ALAHAAAFTSGHATRERGRSARLLAPLLESLAGPPARFRVPILAQVAVVALERREHHAQQHAVRADLAGLCYVPEHLQRLLRPVTHAEHGGPADLAGQLRLAVRGARHLGEQGVRLVELPLLDVVPTELHLGAPHPVDLGWEAVD